MTTQAAAHTRPRDVASGLVLGLVLGGFAFLVWVGLSGELGRVLKGIVQAQAPAGQTANSTLHWGLAFAATAAVMFAPVAWRHARSAGSWLISTALLATCLAAGALAPDMSTWAAVAVPLVIASTAHLTLSAVRLRQEPLRRKDAAPLPQLSWSVALAAAYGLLAAITVGLR